MLGDQRLNMPGECLLLHLSNHAVTLDAWKACQAELFPSTNWEVQKPKGISVRRTYTPQLPRLPGLSGPSPQTLQVLGTFFAPRLSELLKFHVHIYVVYGRFFISANGSGQDPRGYWSRLRADRYGLHGPGARADRPSQDGLADITRPYHPPILVVICPCLKLTLTPTLTSLACVRQWPAMYEAKDDRPKLLIALRGAAKGFVAIADTPGTQFIEELNYAMLVPTQRSSM